MALFMTRSLTLFLMMLALTGCQAFHVSFASFTRPTTLAMMDPPPGSEEYQQGYIDGCKSGYAAYSNNFNKLFYQWTQDWKLAQEPVYYQIWKDAYAYCANYGMMADMHGLGNFR
jgi:hypothetical protein